VTLVLLAAGGAELLGARPPFQVRTPWWQEVAEVVAGAGVEIDVLRLLHGDRPAPPGGHVTYLAETAARPAGLSPIGADLSAHPRRAAYAEPGGPAASKSWAVAALAALGTPGAAAHQQRTWNLSAIWRLDVDGEPVAWLKQVPPFLAHEPAVLALVGAVTPGLVPPVLATGAAGRTLLAHVPGVDRYGADGQLCAGIAAAFHPVQAHFAERTTELAAAGVPRPGLDPERFAAVAEPYLSTIDGLAALISGLPRRLADAAACGLPDTLVHGDLHPGNVRSVDGARPVILDWGDCTIGNPAFDVLRLTAGLAEPHAAGQGSLGGESASLIEAWAHRWRRTAPGSDPERALELLRPVAALRAAAGYADFLGRIEPAEWPYHAADVPARLTEAVAAAGRARGPRPSTVMPRSDERREDP